MTVHPATPDFHGLDDATYDLAVPVRFDPTPTFRIAASIASILAQPKQIRHSFPLRIPGSNLKQPMRVKRELRFESSRRARQVATTSPAHEATRGDSLSLASRTDRGGLPPGQVLTPPPIFTLPGKSFRSVTIAQWRPMAQRRSRKPIARSASGDDIDVHPLVVAKSPIA
jgi:hypothetical protein